MNVAQSRSLTYLKNTGESRETLRVVQTSRERPARRIFRLLAELGVPCSMTEGLVGHRLDEWDQSTTVHEQKLQALWALAEAYMDVIRQSPGALEGLPDVVLEAQQWDVWYEPPSAAWAIIERKKLLTGPERERTVRRMLALPDELVRPHELPRQHVEAALLPRKTWDIESLPRTFPKGAELVRAVRLYAAGMRPWRMAAVMNRVPSSIDNWYRSGAMDAALAYIRSTQPDKLLHLPDAKTGEDPHPFESSEGAGRLAPPKNGGRGPRKGYKYP